jgi:rhodanese-related sulfurtransferase
MPHQPWQDLSPQEASEALAADPELRVLDVRTPREHQSHRLAHSVLVPVQELQRRIGELDPAGKWLVFCEHGRRSLTACHFLQQAGFTDVRNLSGGIANWVACGLPLER